MVAMCVTDFKSNATHTRRCKGEAAHTHGCKTEVFSLVTPICVVGANYHTHMKHTRGQLGTAVDAK